MWRTGGALKLHATLPALVTLPPTPPAAPTGLSATAGDDDSVTLTWDDPADSTLTGYEYQVNHNDTSTGKLSGWGAWQSIAGSNAATTEHTITGLTGGREYRFRLRALNANSASNAAPTAYPWYVTALQGAPSAPTGITVDVDLNVMTVGWNAVAGADGYDVRTRMDDAEWVVVAADVTGTTVNVIILQMPDHTGVRARAGDAVSAWTDVSRLPPPDVFDPPSGGAQAQNTLAAPTNVQVKRWNGGPRATLSSKDYLTITWDAVPGATGYRIACDWNAGDRYGYGSFRKCGKDGSAWKVYGTSAGTDGVTVRYLDGPKDDGSTGNWVEMIYGEGSLYSVIVQAVKDGTPGDWSAIVEAHPAYLISWGPKIGKYQGLDASSRTASGFTLAWVHVYRSAGYVAECVERVNGKPSGSWTTCGKDDNVFSEKMVNGQAVNTAQAHLYGDTASDRIVTVTIADLDLDTAGQQSFDPWKSYDVRASTLNPSGRSLADYPPLSITEPYYNLAASNVTSSGATLSVTNYAQGWWYERTSPSGDSTCHSVSASPYTASLSSLTPGTTYTYKVYDQSGCNAANEKDSVSFTTPKPAASQVTATTAALSLSNWSAAWWYKGNQSGATCTSVAAGTTTVNLGSLTAGTPYTYTTYSKDGCGSADAIGTATFTTSPLAKGRHAGKDFDTLNAAGNNNPHGLWSDGAAMWVADPDDDKLYAYQMMPRLTASAVTDTAATLTLANRAGDWHYQADSGPDSTCQGPVSGASEALSGLTGGTPYVYTAYSASGCNNADKVDAVTVTAARLTAGSLATTTATLTLTGHTGNWWLKQTLPAGGTCTAGEADFSHALSGLTSVTAYDYAAYRDSTCTTLIATVAFTTHGLAAGSFSLTGATLTLTGHTGNWWLKRTAPTLGTCTAGEADFSHALSNLTGGTKYTYAAYSTSSCTTPIDTVTFATHGLRAVSVTPTGAMLWLTGHTGDWWLKQTSPSTGTCTAGEADLSHALSGLTTGTSYTYTAYSNSTCATVIDTATFTPAYVAGQRYAGKDFDTLYAAGNNGPRGLWSDGTTMWVSDRADVKLYAYKRSDTSRDSAKDFNSLPAAGNDNPAGIWSDGTTMWVSDRDDAKLYAYKMSDKSRDAGKDFTTLAAAGNNDPYGLWSDGTTMYVVDYADGKIYAYKMSDRSRDAGKDFNTLAAAGNGGPLGLWSDGVTMWVGDWDDDKIYAYKMSDRSRDAGKDFDTLHAAGNHYGSGMWSDGATMWVADLGSDKLWAYQMPARLTASGVAASTATLTLAGYTGNWWLKQTAPTEGTCTAGEADFSHALSTLTAGVTYTWTAYSASGCASAAALAAASFTTTVSVSSLANARNGSALVGRSAGVLWKAAAQFTTGGSAGGYVLSAVTIDFSTVHGSPGDLTVAIYSNSSNRPNASLVTLSGSNPSGEGQATFTCAGSCALAAGTKYHVLLEAPHATGNYNLYHWESSDSANEVTQPSNNGWSIGKSYNHANGTWSESATQYVKFRVRAVPNPALGPTSLTKTTATLALAHYVGAWWYKRTAPSGDDTCHRVANGATASLATLTESTSYTYKAYSASGCNNADEITTATFTTPGPGDRRASLDFDTLSAAGNTIPGGVWSNGTTMWVTDWNDDKLYAYKMSDKSRDAAKDFNTLQAAGNTDPIGIWSDGTTMWVANLGDDKVYAYKMSDKSRDAAKDFNTLQAAGNENVRDIWSDGTMTWAADYSDDKLYAYKLSDKAGTRARTSTP